MVLILKLQTIMINIPHSYVVIDELKVKINILELF
jgi:hypothetical protein